MMPAKLVDVLFPPVVRTDPFSKLTVPAPASEPMVSELMTNSREPVTMLTATVSASAVPLAKLTSPPLIVSGPARPGCF